MTRKKRARERKRREGKGLSKTDRIRLNQVIRILSNHYKGKCIWKEFAMVLGKEIREKELRNPFKNLVMSVLSQNTSDVNAAHAYLKLKKTIKEITPRNLARANLSEIEQAIRQAGLYRQKAKRLKRLALWAIKKYRGDLTELAKKEKEEIRRELTSLSGIGKKTADVFIAYCTRFDAFPIDTNVRRVLIRLGFARTNDGYEAMQARCEKAIKATSLSRAHELLLRLGRDYCRARSTRCELCPVKALCASYSESRGS